MWKIKKQAHQILGSRANVRLTNFRSRSMDASRAFAPSGSLATSCSTIRQCNESASERASL